MPSFRVEVDHVVDYDFEVFCGTCGTGICDHADTRLSRSRSFPQLTVEVCKHCKQEWEEKIDDLNQRNDSLQDEVNSLCEQVDHWEKIAKEYGYV